MSGFVVILRRDLRLALRQGSDVAVAVLFFVLTVILFPFGVGPEPNLLSRMGPGVIWVAALLSSLLSLDRLFQADYDDGNLDLLALAPLPLEAIVLAKVTAHWLVTAVPLIAVAPLLALMMQMPADTIAVQLGALALGTPALSLIGAVGAALTLGARRGGVLLALLVLPLYIPVLIFGAAAVDAAAAGLSPRAHLLLLASLAVGALALAPFAAAAAVRDAVS